MKITTLDAYARKEHLLKKQSDQVSQGAEDCLKKNEDCLFFQDRSPYVYLFAHPRTDDEGRNKRMLWQPRLIKPEAQTNSYLFRAKSKTDNIEICWMIPDQTLWGQHQEGNVTESEIVQWSIDQYLNNKSGLEKPFDDDISEDRAKMIMRELIAYKKRRSKPMILVGS